MKICIITFQYPPMINGGVGTATHRISRNLCKAGHDVHVIAPGNLDVEARIEPSEEDNVVVHRTFPGLGNHYPNPIHMRMVGEYVARLHAQTHFNLLHGFFLVPTGYLATLLAKQLGLPVVVSIRGSDMELFQYSPTLFGTMRWTLENASLTTSVATNLLDKARNVADIQEGCVVHNAIDLSVFEHRPLSEILGNGAPSRRGFIRRLTRRKVTSLTARGFLERDKACLLVVIGAMSDGSKEILALVPGYRESTESWLAVLRDLRDRGLEILDDRQGTGATLITSQYPVNTWHELAGDPTVGDAILDRLVHNAHKLELKGDSLRKKGGKT